jgi:hypothetical protein
VTDAPAAPITPLDNAWQALEAAGDNINDYLADRHKALREGETFSQGDVRLMSEYAGACASFALAVEIRNFKAAWQTIAAYTAQNGAAGPPPPQIWRPGMPL